MTRPIFILKLVAAQDILRILKNITQFILIYKICVLFSAIH